MESARRPDGDTIVIQVQCEGRAGCGKEVNERRDGAVIVLDRRPYSQNYENERENFIPKSCKC
jgi:hypothetical protein